jgi:hypothetical protein
MTTRSVSLLTSLAALLLVFVTGIGSASAQSDDCPSSNPPDELVLAAGSGQTAQLGNPFPTSLLAKLTNRNGCPVTGNLAGINVTFDAPGSGPSGIFAGSGSREATVGTDAQGVATAPAFTANDTAGSYTVDAHSDYGSAEFSLSNTTNGLAAEIGASSGSDQAATVYSRYPQPLQARVTDANGNAVQGATVSFAVLPGSTGASATFLTGPQATATTNSDGLATSPPLLANGNPGRFSAVASADGLGSVATYMLDNHAATQTLTVLDARSQSATIGIPYSSPLTVRLVDSSGQPIEGGVVTFMLGTQGDNRSAGSAGSGGFFAGGTNQATALTDANGVATSPAFTANASTGNFTATATAAGSAAVTFALRNLPARVSLVARSRSTTVARGYRARLVATLRDNRNRSIRGASVVFTVTTSSRASANFLDGNKQATVETGANGRAIAPPLVANTIAGTFVVTAGIAGSTDLARARLRNLAGRPATVTVGAASGESTPTSSRFPVPLAVTVADRYGNRVAGARVTFSTRAHGASGYFAAVHKRGTARVRTNAQGIAVAPPFTANDVVGGYLVRASVERTGAHGSFALVNTPRP